MVQSADARTEEGRMGDLEVEAPVAIARSGSARSAFTWQLELCLLIDEVARMQRTIAGQKMAQFGLTHIQYLALAYVRHREGMTQTDLQRLLEITRGACTQLVDRLVRADMMERRPDAKDRRLNRLFLSARSQAMLEESRPVTEHIHLGMFENVSEAEGASAKALLTLCKQRLLALSGCTTQDSDGEAAA
jgi:MarR family transcriptional regulator for hemolysin